MIVDLLLIAACLGLAVWAARDTVHTRHHLMTTHKRRHTDQ